MSKSQAALEFLTTYVWAFVVIAITIGALYYFGVFDFGKYLPQKCAFPSQFRCIDFSLTPSDIKAKLTNNLGEDVTVKSLQITNDASPPIGSCSSIIPAVPFDWAASADKELIFTGCSGGGYTADARIELKITMAYFAINTPSQPIHAINGKINGYVSP